MEKKSDTTKTAVTQKPEAVKAAVKKPAAEKPAQKKTSAVKTAASGAQAKAKTAAARKKPAAKKPVKKAELLRRSPDLEDEYGLKLFFQPVYQLSQDRVYGYECLLRIVDKELGTITPDLFLSVARKNPALMKGIEEWSLREIFKTSRQFRENKRYVEMLSLNIDTNNFIKKDFYDKVSAYLEKITENIYFELKEDVFFDGDKSVGETLKKLREAGIKIAVDDFTANFLTFDWGDEVPFDMIKIERTYIDRFLTSPKARLIVEKIVEFAKVRKLELVAVGVESREQEQALGKLGIDKMQGYYYSKPMQFKRLMESEAAATKAPTQAALPGPAKSGLAANSDGKAAPQTLKEPASQKDSKEQPAAGLLRKQTDALSKGEKPAPPTEAEPIPSASDGTAKA